MATDSIKRRILRELCDRPLIWGPNREAAITPMGHEMLFVGFVAERWLQSAPTGPLDFDGVEAQAAIATLLEAWSTTLVHSLAREPLTLPELDRRIEFLDRTGLQRRLLAMQRAGQVEAHPEEGEGAVYAVTDWLRAAIAPLAAAARLERENEMDGAAPIEHLDVEAAFLLTLPLLELPTDLAGSCRLGVEIDGGELPHLAGVTAHVEGGRVTACDPTLDEDPDTWATASPGEWLDTVIEPETLKVDTGGDLRLAGALLEGLHSTLFGIPVR